ncbi:MAG: class I SAM-dependent methyltransferase [Spartobacteria bacterium]
MAADRDYILGTHDEEIARLGLQHRVWRSVALECWLKAGIAAGHRVLDVGAGPGYATVDLAEIVGPGGEVIALERSNKFVSAMQETIRACAIANVKIHELDLMTDELPAGEYDFSWCRWVATFVNDPALLIQKLSRVMRKGGMSIFHEYGDYLSWRFSPRLPNQEMFAQKVAESWRATGGEPDIALELLPLLISSGYRIHSIVPRIFCIRQQDEMWQWPATFIPIGLARLQELGVIDRQFADQVNADFAAANANPNALMITPLVLEIVAERI